MTDTWLLSFARAHCLKGVIRVTESKTEAPVSPLGRVSGYICRVYVWKGDALQPCDPNGKADPYLKCTVGKFHVSCRKKHIKATLKPDFFEFFEIPLLIPGESQLKLGVYDWDRFHLPGPFIWANIGPLLSYTCTNQTLRLPYT